MKFKCLCCLSSVNSQDVTSSEKSPPHPPPSPRFAHLASGSSVPRAGSEDGTTSTSPTLYKRRTQLRERLSEKQLQELKVNVK